MKALALVTRVQLRALHSRKRGVTSWKFGEQRVGLVIILNSVQMLAWMDLAAILMEK